MNTIELDKSGELAVIRLNRPKALNAVNKEMLGELQDIVQTLEEDPKVRCTILTGAGDKAFAAGADVAEMAGMSVKEAETFSEAGCMVADRLSMLPMPVIAAINGYALGGGLEFAMACDIRLAADTAAMGLPETTLGIMPGWKGTVRLASIAGYADACEMIFTGKIIDAQEALRLRLVNRVCPKEGLMRETEELAHTICANAPLGIRNAKKSMKSNLDQIRRISLFSELFLSKDQKIGMDNFCKKQKTEHFTGE